MATVTADSVRDELIRRLSGLSAGEVVVQSVDVTDDYWPDDRPTQVVVHLRDPKRETWDADDMSQLALKVYAVLAEFEVLATSRTTFTGGTPVDDEPVPDEDSTEPE